VRFDQLDRAYRARLHGLEVSPHQGYRYELVELGVLRVRPLVADVLVGRTGYVAAWPLVAACLEHAAELRYDMTFNDSGIVEDGVGPMPVGRYVLVGTRGWTKEEHGAPSNWYPELAPDVMLGDAGRGFLPDGSEVKGDSAMARGDWCVEAVWEVP